MDSGWCFSNTSLLLPMPGSPHRTWTSGKIPSLNICIAFSSCSSAIIRDLMPVPGHILSVVKCTPGLSPHVFLYVSFWPHFLGQAGSQFAFACGALCKQRWSCDVVEVIDAPLLRFVRFRGIGERVVGEKAPLDASTTNETLTTGSDGAGAILGLTQCTKLHLMFWEIRCEHVHVNDVRTLHGPESFITRNGLSKQKNHACDRGGVQERSGRSR